MSDRSTFVTIMVPAYNAAATIGKTLDSILTQRGIDFEVIVSDNHSTDNTAEIVQRYAVSDSRVVPLQALIPPPDPQEGLVAVSLSAVRHFNALLDHGRGELICLYHADDIYDPDIVAKEVDFLNRHSEASAVFTLGRIIDEAGAPRYGAPRLLPEPIRPKEVFDFPALFEATLLYGGFIMCPTMAARRSLLKKVGGFRAEFEQATDYDLWFRLAREAPIGIIQESLFSRRISTRSDSYRGRTIYHDRPLPIFKVYDHFLATTDVAQRIVPQALQAMEVARSIDRLRLARSFLLDGQRDRARQVLRDALIAGHPKPTTWRDRFFIWSGWLLWACVHLGLGKVVACLQNEFQDSWSRRLRNLLTRAKA